VAFYTLHPRPLSAPHPLRSSTAFVAPSYFVSPTQSCAPEESATSGRRSTSLARQETESPASRLSGAQRRANVPGSDKRQRLQSAITAARRQSTQVASHEGATMTSSTAPSNRSTFGKLMWSFPDERCFLTYRDGRLVTALNRYTSPRFGKPFPVGPGHPVSSSRHGCCFSSCCISVRHHGEASRELRCGRAVASEPAMIR
jgi:hypothetical protein